MENISCHSDESTCATVIKNTNFREEDFCIFLFANLVFRLPWQQIKFSSLDKIYMVGVGLLKEHY